ncbi:MAG: NFACT RNA binding domain-containing protein, partial [Eubacteriales bacterium]|nr:NFACT RNA binding domain-containing protein [Eubacteriales bacterium]
ARGQNKIDKPKPQKYTISSGKTVLVGRNNKENDWLTFKKASSQDIWFHTKDIHGSHAILFTEGESPSEEELFQAAAIAAYHSKAQTSQNVPVDYTRARYVKKPAGSKPGYVIFTHNKTLYVNPALPE